MKSFPNYLHHVCMTRVCFGDVGSVPIDQTPAQEFNIDPHTGRPMSDIQRLVHIQNDLQLASEFAQLHEFKPKFIDKDMSDSDALRFAVPRLSQLPSELLEHRTKLINEHNAKVKEMALKEARKKDIVRQNDMFEKILNETKKD